MLAFHLGTFGSLFVDGRWFCFTLEDIMRDVKIPNETAIPMGTYAVALSPSERFHRLLPRLLNVPNFTGILIHGGNTTADTSGCILVGKRRAGTMLLESLQASMALVEMLKGHDAITITIEAA